MADKPRASDSMKSGSRGGAGGDERPRGAWVGGGGDGRTRSMRRRLSHNLFDYRLTTL
jgi:hypothetical protein